MRGRVQRILAAAGVASRRKAEELLRDGRISVNGRTARLGDAADSERDSIEVDGERVRLDQSAYWMVHKPRGVLTTTRDPEGRPTVLALLPARGRRVRLFPVGRLDRESQGLVLLTNDGELAHALLHPSLGSEREYRVRVRGCVRPATLARLGRGVRLEDGRTAPARTGRPSYQQASDTTSFTLVLHEGRKRQIRRVMLALGHPVCSLVRVRLGPLRLSGLEPGGARPLLPAEVLRLREHARRLRDRAARKPLPARRRRAGRT